MPNNSSPITPLAFLIMADDTSVYDPSVSRSLIKNTLCSPARSVFVLVVPLLNSMDKVIVEETKE